MDPSSNDINKNVDVTGEQECWRMLYRTGDENTSFAQSFNKLIQDDHLKSNLAQKEKKNKHTKASIPTKQVSIKGPAGSKKHCVCTDSLWTPDMIGCDFCDMWYHPTCIGLTKDDATKAVGTKWFCPKCDRLCDGMFIKLPDNSMVKNREGKKQKIQRLEIEQSFDLIDCKNNKNFMNPTENPRKTKKRTSELKKRHPKVNQRLHEREEIKKCCKGNNNRAAFSGKSKKHKWIIRKKYYSFSDSYTSSALVPLDRSDIGKMSKKPNLRLSKVSKMSRYKTKASERNVKTNMEDSFVFSKTVPIKIKSNAS